MNLKELTLIVPTKNEAVNIDRFLDSVPIHIKMIIVDASCDNTREIILRKSRPVIHTIHDEGNIATARQLAAEHAVTEWLLYSDADVCFDENYFDILANLPLSEHHGGLMGAKHSRDRYRRYYQLFSHWLRWCCALGLPSASGSNMLVRRQALLTVGGFDLSLSCNEDSELMYRIHRLGYKVAYEGRLKVYEFDHRRLDRGLMRKTAHSIIRCALLACGWNSMIRKHDWGYWRI
ncbi:MAG: glycosyltransferase [Deltaproteobacteria bacterium]|nr:glycosyltransferase [Deltaproteobacteria bacterium]